MAEFRWRGNGAGTKSDWDDGRNWHDATETPYAAARFPGSLVGTNDDVIFDAQLVAGALGPTTNMDRAGDEELLSFKVTAAYRLAGVDGTGPIGTAGAPLRISVDGAGYNTMLDCSSCDDVYMEGIAPSGINPVVLGTYTGKTIFFLDAGGPIFLVKGNVNMLGGTPSLLHVSYASNNLTDVTLAIQSAVDLTTCNTIISGGTVTCYTQITDVNYSAIMHQGILNLYADSVGEFTQVGGTINWHAGDIDTLRVFGGLFDGSMSNAPRDLVGAMVATGSVLNLANAARNINVTGILAFGGLIIWPNGEMVTIA